MSNPRTLALLLACAGLSACWDLDHDGYRDLNAGGDDCDDRDPAIHPGAEELCNGTDDDCDGTVDEGDAVDAPTWYLDDDVDGYGDDASTVQACTQPSGYGDTPGDCDDGDPEVHPEADERCNGADDDCDGTVDEDDAVDAAIWYADADGDGFGWAEDGVVACTQPTGRVADSADCDDDDPAIHPGATTWHPDDDSDGYGDPDEISMACEAPPSWIVDDQDCDDGDATVYPGAEEICGDGALNDCDATVSPCSGIYGDIELGDAAVKIVGEDLYNEFAVAMDMGDGVLVVSAQDGTSHRYRGWAYVFYGAPTSGVATNIADAVLRGASGGDVFGQDVAVAGDLDGDGVDDILVGARSGDDGTGTDPGVAYLFLGPLSGEIEASDADAAYAGEHGGEWAGATLAAAGDTDGDGVAEFLVGALEFDRTEVVGRPDTGAAYLVEGAHFGSQGIEDVAQTRLVGVMEADEAASALDGAGDLNGDGLDDLVIGARRVWGTHPEQGRAYVLYGPVPTGTLYLSDADLMLDGEDAFHWAGASVAGAGDVDADGLDDLLVGAPYGGGEDTYPGRAYLVPGAVSSSGTLGDLAVATLTGVTDWECSYRVSTAGDVNADGFTDFMVSASAEDSRGANAGAAYLLLGPVAGDLGPADADARIYGEDEQDYAGGCTAGGGDLDGDGFDDIAIGAWIDKFSDGWTGAAYVLFGGEGP
ncbi:MAG: MopE-related protein [Pseudomonadota bacterium]